MRASQLPLSGGNNPNYDRRRIPSRTERPRREKQNAPKEYLNECIFLRVAGRNGGHNESILTLVTARASRERDEAETVLMR